MEAGFQRSSQTPTTLLVPGLPADCPLLFTWCGPQRLALYPLPRGEEAGQWAGLTSVSWDAAQWNSITRRLANQSHGYFMALHKAGREEGGLQGSDILLYSRYFRSALHECVQSLRAEEEREPGTGERGRLSHVFSAMSLIWHLVEILFIEVLPAGCLVKQLVEWVSWAGQERERGQLHNILSHTPPEGHEGYWRLLYRLVLTGRLSEASSLLAHHSAYTLREDLFSSIDQLLQKAPMVRPAASLTRGEQQHIWQQWQREVSARRDSGSFLSFPQLELLSRVSHCPLTHTDTELLSLQILSGEEKVFACREVLESCESWYELMVAQLLFTTPLVVSTDYDLVYAAEAAMKAYEVTPSPLDSLLLAALRQSPLEVVSLASSELSNWWLAAHLADLLQQRDSLHAQPEYGSKLTEFLIIEYASSLLAHPSLWQLAMDYFSECPKQGRHYMSLHIERIPLTSTRKVAKVLQLCQRFQLMEQGKSVCRVLAMRELRAGRLGAALSWCLPIRDSVFAAFLAERYFTSYQTLGEFMDIDLLDNLGATMLISPKLTFLGKYREFHQLFAESQFRAAGQLLVSLLQSGVVPKRFWLTLLMDALPLLNLKDQIIFSSEDTITLSHCLQQLTSSLDQSCSLAKSHYSTKSSSSDPVSAKCGKISLLRVALCRNLSLATLEEAQET